MSSKTLRLTLLHTYLGDILRLRWCLSPCLMYISKPNLCLRLVLTGEDGWSSFQHRTPTEMVDFKTCGHQFLRLVAGNSASSRPSWPSWSQAQRRRRVTAKNHLPLYLPWPLFVTYRVKAGVLVSLPPLRPSLFSSAFGLLEPYCHSLLRLTIHRVLISKVTIEVTHPLNTYWKQCL